MLKLMLSYNHRGRIYPAAFGRLCVETYNRDKKAFLQEPAAFGRLCVETLPISPFDFAVRASRLRAAVC